MKSILLINPLYELEIRWIANEQQMGVKADYFPLGLATVAALCPEGYDVDIWDELVRGPVEKANLSKRYDLVGVTSHRANFQRAFDISSFFRAQGIPVVVGGPGVSGSPDRCRGKFDVLVIGEAELIWPEFLRDWEAGQHRGEYRQVAKPDITRSPLPDWSSILSDVPYYAMGTVQTTRGCPFDCEFCDVIYLNGRAQRYKTTEQILSEVRALERLGVESISFNDDNFTANHRWAKDVLRALIDLNATFSRPVRFSTQLSIDAADDEELLELLADANFYQFLIGIETPNKESLKETHKLQNLRGNLVDQVHKVLSYGLVVRAGMIVGFDNDDLDIFDAQYEFIQDCALPSISLHMLNAPMGTRLWRRLREEGRVIDALAISAGSTQRLFNNIIPKKMTRVQLMEGFLRLYSRVFTWESFEERMCAFVDLVEREPRVRQQVIPLEDVVNLGRRMNLDEESCQAMERIFRHAHKKPFMMFRVKELVVQFVRYRKSAQEFAPGLRRQIELESTGQMEVRPDVRPITVPAGFRDGYARTYFRKVYERAYRLLDDREKISDALVDVFVDFLMRDESFQGWQDHHLSVLQEITDRTCAVFNGVRPESFLPTDREDISVPNVARQRLHEDVLMVVEQELMKVALGEGARLAVAGGPCVE
jgi:radical SAM superfamily enzyme YgiQ (UPF0313 family)